MAKNYILLLKLNKHLVHTQRFLSYDVMLIIRDKISGVFFILNEGKSILYCLTAQRNQVSKKKHLFAHQ